MQPQRVLGAQMPAQQLAPLVEVLCVLRLGRQLCVANIGRRRGREIVQIHVQRAALRPLDGHRPLLDGAGEYDAAVLLYAVAALGIVNVRSAEYRGAQQRPVAIG